jgi:aspartate-semialdehyde dehydrogenase
LRGQSGVTVFDGDLPYPTPMSAEDKDGVQVGRIRRDPDYAKGWHMFVVADNLRKGAATNAVQIAEALIAAEAPVPN